MTDLFVISDAVLSPCEQYRYLLSRQWSENEKPTVLWIMLNPSTADANVDDATITRLIRRSMGGDYGRLLVCNLFAFRSTDPRRLTADVSDPIGPWNNQFIRQALADANTVFCGWGNHGALWNRDKTVLRMARDAGHTPLCLGLTRTNQPRHPLYVGYDVRPMEMAA